MRMLIAFGLCLLSNIYAGGENSIVQSNAKGEMISLEVLTKEGRVFLASTHFSTDPSGKTFTYNISNLERDVIVLPLLSMSNAGESVAVWQSLNSLTNTIYIEAAAYSNDFGWSTPKIISGDLESIEAGNYRMHLSESGYLLVFWSSILPDGNSTIAKNRVVKITDLFE